jgi:23S rRNA pseudouridine1911/1915/1917 synthase
MSRWVNLPTVPSDKLDILWTSGRIVAVDKPAGLATIPGRGERDSVLERLAAQMELPHTGTADPRLRVVHRLDKETSGVLIFATDVAAQRHLSHQFQNNTAEKEYLAIVAGRPSASEGEIDAPLAAHPADPQRMTVFKHGRPARTLWRVEEQFRGFALLRVWPKTGKTHQIRVHLQSIGLPLAIDPLYNPPRNDGRRRRDERHADTAGGLYLSQLKRDYRRSRGEEERPLIDRLTLHAERLSFRDMEGELVSVTAPLPRNFRAALNQLRRWAK